MVGGVEVWALLDMIPPAYTPDDFFPSIPLDWWEPYRKEVFDQDGNLQLYYGCFAVRSQGKLILVDTGMGPGPHPERGNRRGELTQRMNEEGLAPEDVDYVVHTHLHGDHVGWNLDAQGRPTFPSARYLAPKADWEYFRQADVAPTAPFVAECVAPLEPLGVMDLVEGEHAITDEVGHAADTRAYAGASDRGDCVAGAAGRGCGGPDSERGAGDEAGVGFEGRRGLGAGAGDAAGDDGTDSAGRHAGCGGALSDGRPLWTDYDVGGAALLADREARRVGMVRESPPCHSEYNDPIMSF